MAVRGSWCLVGYAETVLRRTGCTSRRRLRTRAAVDTPGIAAGVLTTLRTDNYHGQPATPCPSYDTVASTAPEVIAHRVGQQKSMTGRRPPVKTILDSRNENSP